MYNSAISDYSLSDSGEYFLNVEDIEVSPKSIKAYIPKLMPNIEMGEKAIDNMKVSINPSIFVNAPECTVTGVSPTATSQNYLTLKPYNNQQPNFKSKAILIDKDTNKYIVKKHNKFVMEILHGDIGNMYFTEKI